MGNGVQVYPNSRVLVVSTENITQNWYFGEERSMLIPNCLFRIGGASIVMSNRLERPSTRYPAHSTGVARKQLGSCIASHREYPQISI